MLFGVLRPFLFFPESLLLSSIVKRGFLVAVLDEDFLVLLEVDHDLLFHLEVVVVLPLQVLRTQLGLVPPLQITAVPTNPFPIIPIDTFFSSVLIIFPFQ